MGEWKILERPGYFGKKRDAYTGEMDKKYGIANWRIRWKVADNFVDKNGMCALYEDAYFNYFKEHPIIAHLLVDEASDVYDDELSNVRSGLDYWVQETGRNHIQDIAIRRCLVRMGLWFKGKEPIQIRQELGKHPLSMTLSPGKIIFHMPQLIEQPEITGWWDGKSVESFYQSNKYLQVKEKVNVHTENASS